MKLINNRWVDDNNNSWDADFESEESSILKSKSLSYCSYCSDCSGCSGCSYCRDCRDCSDCSGCSYCRDCSDCSDCSYCRDCSDCSYCRDCRDCSDCSGCSYCRDCSGCSYCRDCSEIKSNPQRYVTPRIGSRNSQTSIYWTSKEDIQIICGCWRGNIQEFEKRVKEVHTGKYLTDYMNQIKIFKYLTK
jgi:hypothetical protein